MNRPIRDALLVLNPRAGRVGTLLTGGGLDRVRYILSGQGIESEVVRTESPDAAEEASRGAIGRRKDLVIACGGDGTLNAVVNGLAGSQVPMALLPAGTANILAKELNLPANLERAAESLGSGTLRRIALGMVTTSDRGMPRSRYFLSVGGAGPDGAIVHAVNGELKRRTGMLAYWVEGLRQFVSYSFPRFQVASNGTALPATMVVVGRTRNYGGPLRITTEADLYGNDFELMVCSTRSRFRYLSYVPLAIAGRLRSAPGTTFLKTRSFRCEPIDAPNVFVQVDGEPVGQLPAEFHVAPDALTLLVPGASHRKVR